MLSFKILLFTCAFYLVQARPEPITTDAELQPVTDSPPAVPEKATLPYFNAGKHQEQVDGLMKDMIHALDKHMLPLMSKLNEETKEELLTMAINGLTGYLNYVFLLIEGDESKNATASVPADKVLDKDDIIVEFDELHPEFTSGLIPAAPIDGDQEPQTEIASEPQSEEGAAPIDGDQEPQTEIVSEPQSEEGAAPIDGDQEPQTEIASEPQSEEGSEATATPVEIEPGTEIEEEEEEDDATVEDAVDSSATD